ncbi:MAG TPA: hypothetical protein PK490_06430 [Prosthecobacter sp.]|nr:hypothetical protein [Prosthecobacter sp.]HRK13906.1 hypothetical protein [Prosthecobacter sp.]
MSRLNVGLRLTNGWLRHPNDGIDPASAGTAGGPCARAGSHQKAWGDAAATGTQLDAAIATRARSVAGVPQLKMTADSEYNPGQMQEIVHNSKALLQALQSGG